MKKREKKKLKKAARRAAKKAEAQKEKVVVSFEEMVLAVLQGLATLDPDMARSPEELMALRAAAYCGGDIRRFKVLLREHLQLSGES